ncbi:helix-turn-helix domain-containing protein [Streptomyces sp. NPDC057697]|uniref:helix-turn-helix domain-containing protein n=1 Tax=Streptomyces sp. NPDC057697 TaxID=3346219 RepID=UPI00369E085C
MSARPDNVSLFPQPRKRELTPTAAGLVLGAELRQLRTRCGLTATAAAKLINASTSKVSRLERAESPPDRRDVRELAAHYRANAAKTAELEELTRRALDPEWCDRYSDYTGEYMMRLIALESEARSLWTYESKLAPGLLQTSEYARRIITDGLRVSEGDQVEQRVALREERQRRFFDQDDPPRGTFLLDESVLLRQVGTPQIMAGQLHKLESFIDRPGVTILFVPLNGAFVSNYNSMTHLAFGQGGPPPMVYVEGDDEATYIVKTEDVERRMESLLRLGHESAASWRDSRTILRDAIRRYER